MQREREGAGGGRCCKSLTAEERREGWSRIELRILDSRVPRKASIRAATASTDALLGCECRLQQPPTPQHHRRRSSRPAAERFPKTGSLWTDRDGRANQGACRAMCSCSGRSYMPTPVSTPFTQFCSWSLSSFYFMVSVFKGLSFVLWKAVWLSHPFVEWTYCWIVGSVTCTETLAKSSMKQNT